jgi:hypothetical protein
LLNHVRKPLSYLAFFPSISDDFYQFERPGKTNAADGRKKPELIRGGKRRAMLSPEQLRGHEDVLDDPRAGFNRLCEALILSVSHNSRLSLRMVQEIHSLAQHIGADSAAKETAMNIASPRVASSSRTGPVLETAAPDRAAPSFRLRLPGQGRGENPFASILDELAGVRGSVQMAHAALSTDTASARAAPPPRAESGPSPDYVNRLKDAVAQQNAVLEELVAGYKSNCAELQRLEDEMTRNPEGQGVAAELEQLRRTVQRQEQHLLALALAVKRLAAVLSD